MRPGSVKALYACILGWQHTAPVTASRLWERSAFCERAGWTFEQYDNARAGDIEFHKNFWKMCDEAEKRELEKLKSGK